MSHRFHEILVRKRCRIAKAILKKKKDGGITLSDFEYIKKLH
jgi:hypothetical protein